MSGMSLRWARRIAGTVGLSCAMATVAFAAPITYTFNGTASGRLGATTFTNAAFVVTAVGDTADITSLGAGVPCNDFTGAAFTLGGIGSGYITSPISVAANTGMQLLALTVGSCADTGLIWISGYDARVSTYGLNTGIGPLSLGTPSPQSAVAPNTSSGVLTITDISAMKFQATAGYTLTPVAGLWWNPSESGSGYNLDVKNGVLVVTIYSYKDSGEAQWYITSGPITNNSFTGTINKYVWRPVYFVHLQGAPDGWRQRRCRHDRLFLAHVGKPVASRRTRDADSAADVLTEGHASGRREPDAAAEESGEPRAAREPVRLCWMAYRRDRESPG